ncbi:3-methylcrotonyl-CoA carboxylase, partial [Pseudomonas aeruginosa]|nr:3-methylcrotonyl-CoA carboxylase [Pseudomonas aeruginosa]
GNQRFLANLLAHPDFAAGEATTAFIGERFAEDPSLQPRQPGAGLVEQGGAEASAHQPGLAGWRSAAGAPWKVVLKHAEQRLEIGLEVLES